MCGGIKYFGFWKYINFQKGDKVNLSLIIWMWPIDFAFGFFFFILVKYHIHNSTTQFPYFFIFFIFKFVTNFKPQTKSSIDDSIICIHMEILSKFYIFFCYLFNCFIYYFFYFQFWYGKARVRLAFSMLVSSWIHSPSIHRGVIVPSLLKLMFKPCRSFVIEFWRRYCA